MDGQILFTSRSVGTWLSMLGKDMLGKVFSNISWHMQAFAAAALILFMMEVLEPSFKENNDSFASRTEMLGITTVSFMFVSAILNESDH